MATAAERPILVRQARVIDPAQGIDAVGDVLFAEGKVAALRFAADRPLEAPPGCLVLRGEGLVIAPGFVDLHAHLREPGYEEKETIATGTRAAAKGGFTTICCMPNTQPPLDTRATVEFVRRRAADEGAVRVLPIGCITQGRKGQELAEMGELAEAGVVAFSDDGSPVASARLMRSALSYAKAFGLPLIEHCEEPGLSQGGVMNEGWVATRLGLRGIPAAAEEIMAARDIALAELTGGRLHIAHASAAGMVDLVRRAKEKGVRVTAEATPHHLTMTDEWVLGYRPGRGPSGAAQLAYHTSTKVNPPLRAQRDAQALVQGLREGVIDAIATDHAPHADIDKLCEYDAAPFGISVFETALGSLLSLVHGGALDLGTLIARLTVGPARVLGREASGLGSLRAGAPADAVVFDPDEEWTVDVERFVSWGKNSPLHGCTLKGRVKLTLVGGAIAYVDEGVQLES